jgi:hypothetical protein
MYTEEGRKYMDRLWDCTIEELDCAEVRQALKAIKS